MILHISSCAEKTTLKYCTSFSPRVNISEEPETVLCFVCLSVWRYFCYCCTDTTYLPESMQEVLGMTVISFRRQFTLVKTSQLVSAAEELPLSFTLHLKPCVRTQNQDWASVPFLFLAGIGSNVLTLCSKKSNEYDGNSFCSISLPEMMSSKVKNRWYASFLSSRIKTGSCTMYCSSNLK